MNVSGTCESGINEPKQIKDEIRSKEETIKELKRIEDEIREKKKTVRELKVKVITDIVAENGGSVRFDPGKGIGVFSLTEARIEDGVAVFVLSGRHSSATIPAEMLTDDNLNKILTMLTTG